jgi:hypothetical protein
MLDQACAVLIFLEACADRDNKTPPGGRTWTVSLTAPQGLGKSAALGLCLAGALSFGFGQVAVKAPEPENLPAVFHFLVDGLRALKYQEHYDYTLRYNYGSMDVDDGGSGGGKNRGKKAGSDSTKGMVSMTVHKTTMQGGEERRGGRGARESWGLTQGQTVRHVRLLNAEGLPAPIWWRSTRWW